MKISIAKAQETISNFKNTKILVVGDLMLDIFIWGDVKRISPEAPVPVVDVERESSMPGGSANVVNNVCAMGGKCFVSGIIGDDAYGTHLINELKQEGAQVEGILKDPGRVTTVKTRIIARHQQVVRYDREVKHALGSRFFEELKYFCSSIIDDIDAIIIEDYGKGFVSQDLMRYLIEVSKEKDKIVTFDPKIGRDLDIHGITAVTPNLEEAYYFAGISDQDDSDEVIYDIGEKLIKKWDAQAVLITLGDKGMYLFEKNKPPFNIPTVAREVFDVSGAGDTVMGAFSLSLASGSNAKDAAILANFAAGVVVGKLGTGVATAKEIIKAIENEK